MNTKDGDPTTAVGKIAPPFPAMGIRGGNRLVSKFAGIIGNGVKVDGGGDDNLGKSLQRS